MKIYIASDHKGFEKEPALVEYLEKMGLEVYQVNSEHNPLDDYPDYAFDLCNHVLSENSLGILLCGTGIGMSIAANKVKGIRAARCVDVNDAFYAKRHNDANVICLGMENSLEKTEEIIDTFINTARANEEKHLNRVNKIINYEKVA